MKLKINLTNTLPLLKQNSQDHQLSGCKVSKSTIRNTKEIAGDIRREAQKIQTDKNWKTYKDKRSEIKKVIKEKKTRF